MPLPQSEQILLVADHDRQVHAALVSAMPDASVTVAASYFEAIADLSANRYSTVLASAEPIERRPEAAVRVLRQLAGEGRLILFGQPSIEPVSRKMLGFGCDDYIVTPVTSGELSQVFGMPSLRIAGATDSDAPLAASAPAHSSLLAGLPLADIVLDAILLHPHGGPAAAIAQVNTRIAPLMRLHYTLATEAAPTAPDGLIALSHDIRVNSNTVAALHLLVPRDEEQSAARHFLSQLAHLVAKLASIEDRHLKLQRLAITDDLTNLCNARYFRHFLSAILQKAQAMRFPVTLLLFDIDDFKAYNDQHGHGVGDDILRQTAALMKRCVRDHDLVARLGGDEFAVVFWEKEGPRQPREIRPTGASRIPQTPIQIFERFKRLLASPEFSILGNTGQGQLTISAAMAVYPWNAQDVQGLIDAADRELMFNAKVSGKNCLRLVGEEPPEMAR